MNNEVPPPVYKAAADPAPVPGAEASIGDTLPQDPVKRGFYLATLAHCMACHARKPDGGADFKNWWGKGGYEMKGPYGSAVVANISSHKEKGVGAWTDAELKRALTEGISRDGRAFKPPMGTATLFQQDDRAKTSTPSLPGCAPFRGSNEVVPEILRRGPPC